MSESEIPRCPAVGCFGESIRCGLEEGHPGVHMGSGKSPAVSVSWGYAEARPATGGAEPTDPAAGGGAGT